MKTFLFVFVVFVFSSLENYFGSRTTNGRVKTNHSVSLRWKKKDFNISKEVCIVLVIVHSICELICVQYFVFFRRAELKPTCFLLLVVTVSILHAQIYLPCLQSKNLRNSKACE